MTIAPPELLPVEQAGLMLIDAATYTDDATMHQVTTSLRLQDPIHRIENPAYPTVWALTRHRDVVEVAKNSVVWPQAKPHSLRSFAESRRCRRSSSRRCASWSTWTATNTATTGR
jgi:hypothetical protein